MPTFTGRWKARVEQDFEIDAETREEAEELLAEQMSPRHVVELIDFEHEFEDEDNDEETLAARDAEELRTS